MLFLVLVTSTKHYWVVSAERRRLWKLLTASAYCSSATDAPLHKADLQVSPAFEVCFERFDLGCERIFQLLDVSSVGVFEFLDFRR